MYISKKIEISWTQEEEKKIQEFRRFLQDTSKKVKDVLPPLYQELDKIDLALYDLIYGCFNDDVDLDD